MPKTRNSDDGHITGNGYTGINFAHHEKPVPFKYLHMQMQGKNGPVVIVKPADPEKIAAYRASLGAS